MVSQINETFPSDSLTTVDLSIGLADIDGKWKLNLIGQNITDEIATDFSGPPAAPIGAIFGAPPGDQGITSESPSQLRTIWLQASYHF
jgi:iron complex outermembrane receptor protein